MAVKIQPKTLLSESEITNLQPLQTLIERVEDFSSQVLVNSSLDYSTTQVDTLVKQVKDQSSQLLERLGNLRGLIFDHQLTCVKKYLNDRQYDALFAYCKELPIEDLLKLFKSDGRFENHVFENVEQWISLFRDQIFKGLLLKSFIKESVSNEKPLKPLLDHAKSLFLAKTREIRSNDIVELVQLFAELIEIDLTHEELIPFCKECLEVLFGEFDPRQFSHPFTKENFYDQTKNIAIFLNHIVYLEHTLKLNIPKECREIIIETCAKFGRTLEEPKRTHFYGMLLGFVDINSEGVVEKTFEHDERNYWKDLSNEKLMPIFTVWMGLHSGGALDNASQIILTMLLEMRSYKGLSEEFCLFLNELPKIYKELGFQRLISPYRKMYLDEPRSIIDQRWDHLTDDDLLGIKNGLDLKGSDSSILFYLIEIEMLYRNEVTENLSSVDSDESEEVELEDESEESRISQTFDQTPPTKSLEWIEFYRDEIPQPQFNGFLKRIAKANYAADDLDKQISSIKDTKVLYYMIESFKEAKQHVFYVGKHLCLIKEAENLLENPQMKEMLREYRFEMISRSRDLKPLEALNFFGFIPMRNTNFWYDAPIELTGPFFEHLKQFQPPDKEAFLSFLFEVLDQAMTEVNKGVMTEIVNSYLTVSL